MDNSADQPVIASQTLAQNEAVENVMSRYRDKELFVPRYQRDADQWDDIKKSLFIESVLNRLTIPAFYLAASERNPEIFEVVDGQQRLTTINAFYTNQFTLLGSDRCPYYGNSAHYAGKRYENLAENWQRVFRRYNLTLVSLPPNMELSLRLEIFRRINEGGTPLSGQDIRLSYYSESEAVKFIQTVGFFDSLREGSKRVIEDVGYPWIWSQYPEASQQWKEWWNDSRTSLGQRASEMFLWYLISRYRNDVDRILVDRRRLVTNLKLTFRGNSDEVLDIVCAQFRYEDCNSEEHRLLPSLETLQKDEFPLFAEWWYKIRLNCGPIANVSKHRPIALLIPALEEIFGRSSPSSPSDNQWTLLGKFLGSTRETARQLQVNFPEPKGKWKTQREQFDAFHNVVKEIFNK
jgi:Protein of unknown function DUF262